MSINFGLPVQIGDFKAANDDWEVSGYISTFGNTDLGYDVVMPGAFDQTLNDGSKKRFLHSHDPRLVLGIPKELKTDKRGLFGRFKISKTKLGEETRQLLIDGALDSFSIGYAADDYEFVDNGQVRRLKSLSLYEASVVAMPMNELATVTAVKDYLSLLGIDPAMTQTEKAHAICEGLNQLLSDMSDVAQAGPRPLNQSKRQELKQILETLSGLDDARSNLVQLLDAAPISLVAGKRALYELHDRRKRFESILKEN